MNQDTNKEFYCIEKLIGKKKVDGNILYLVKWDGYHINESTWEPIDHLDHVSTFVNQFNSCIEGIPLPYVSQQYVDSFKGRHQEGQCELKLKSTKKEQKQKKKINKMRRKSQIDKGNNKSQQNISMQRQTNMSMMQKRQQITIDLSSDRASFSQVSIQKQQMQKSHQLDQSLPKSMIDFLMRAKDKNDRQNMLNLMTTKDQSSSKPLCQQTVEIKKNFWKTFSTDSMIQNIRFQREVRGKELFSNENLYNVISLDGEETQLKTSELVTKHPMEFARFLQSCTIWN